MNNFQRKFYKFLIKSNIFYCPQCGKKNHSYYNSLCHNCRKELNFISSNYCYSCGGELDGALAICSKCLKEKKRTFLHAISIFPYQKFNRELLLSYKNGGKIELSRFFAKTAANKLKRINLDFDLIIPIPLHWTKQLQRGYNQSEFLAELIAAKLNKPCVKKGLKRVKRARQQKQLNSLERHQNLRNAFLADSKIVASQKVLLIDDIFTTGATLENASSALKKAGASVVYVLTIARA